MEVCGVAIEIGYQQNVVDSLIADLLEVSPFCPDGEYDRLFGVHGQENIVSDGGVYKRSNSKLTANLWYIEVVYPVHAHMRVETTCMTTELNRCIWDSSDGDYVWITVLLHHMPITLESLLSEQYTVPEFTIYVDGVKLDEIGHRANYWRPR